MSEEDVVVVLCGGFRERSRSETTKIRCKFCPPLFPAENIAQEFGRCTADAADRRIDNRIPTSCSTTTNPSSDGLFKGQSLREFRLSGSYVHFYPSRLSAFTIPAIFNFEVVSIRPRTLVRRTYPFTTPHGHCSHSLSCLGAATTHHHFRFVPSSPPIEALPSPAHRTRPWPPPNLHVLTLRSHRFYAMDGLLVYPSSFEKRSPLVYVVRTRF